MANAYLRGSQPGILSWQHSDAETSQAAPTKIRTLDVWSSPFISFPGRIWEPGQPHDVVLEGRILVTECLGFSYLLCWG